MAEEAFGPVFEIHGGGLDLVFPHHENELAQSLALGHDFARIWTHNGMLEFGGEKMSKSLGNDVSLRNVLDTWGREVVLLFFLTGHWRKPIDFTDETLAQAQGAGGDASATSSSPSATATRTASRSSSRSSRPLLDDDFNTPDALALFHAWRAREELDVAALRARALRARVARGAAQAPPELVALAEAAPRRARGEGLRRGRPAARRDSTRRLGGARRRRRRPATSSCRSREHASRSTGAARFGRRCAGRARCSSSGRPSGPRRPSRGCARRERPRLQLRQERELSEAAGTRDHQGVLAWCEPYRYADAYELAAGERPLLACLDQVSDPRNLGAVIRSAEGAGATRRRRAGARVGARHAAVCRASAGAVEHLPVAVVTNLARYLAEIKGGRPLGRRGRGRVGDADVAGRPLAAASRSSSAPKGRGCDRSCAGRATSRSRSRSSGRVESLNVSVAAALLLYEARRQRDGRA